MKAMVLLLFILPLSAISFEKDISNQSIETIELPEFAKTEIAANKGDAASQWNLSVLYGMGKGVEKNRELSLKWLKKSSQNGFVNAQHWLGQRYISGDGVVKNLDLGFELTEKAAIQGYLLSQSFLGATYYLGWHDKERNKQEAIKWYEMAAEQGDIISMVDLLEVMMKDEDTDVDFNKIIYWTKKYEEAENTGMHSTLIAYSYESGTKVTQDYALAAKWYSRAISLGDVNALSQLGNLYFRGYGVEKNFSRAAELFKKAADLGNEIGQHNLGMMYLNGNGLEPSLSDAKLWFKKAAKSGYKNSQEKLTFILQIEQCLETATVHVFNVPIKCAYRGQLRNAVKSAGAIAEREDNSFYVDIYDSSKILNGTSTLQIHYHEKFARLEYTFPSNMDVNTVVKVHDFVEAKYGKAKFSIGNNNVGEVSHSWHLEDGIRIEVTRTWPDTTTRLAFINHVVDAEMNKTINRISKERELNKYKEQTNAF